MMTDPKEAAIQRLADVMRERAVHLNDWDEAWMMCARIAIEEAVVPVWEAERAVWTESATGDIPWSAVCAEEKANPGKTHFVGDDCPGGHHEP